MENELSNQNFNEQEIITHDNYNAVYPKADGFYNDCHNSVEIAIKLFNEQNDFIKVTGRDESGNVDINDSLSTNVFSNMLEIITQLGSYDGLCNNLRSQCIECAKVKDDYENSERNKNGGLNG